MCSRKCETPLIVGVSSREPVLTNRPGGEGVRVGVDLGDDVEAVVELVVVEGQGHGAGSDLTYELSLAWMDEIAHASLRRLGALANWRQ